MKVMVTGHRHVAYSDVVVNRYRQVIAALKPALMISGGARGADALWAATAVNAGVPCTVMLPNRWYLSRYPDEISRRVLDAADITYVIDRPDVEDWRERWDSERWWVDNFARNAAMVDASDVTVVVSPTRPDLLAERTRGGTVHCVQQVASRRPASGDGGVPVIWIPDTPDVRPQVVQLAPRKRAKKPGRGSAS